MANTKGRGGRPALSRPDTTFTRSNEYSDQHRVAWLLRTNRLFGNDPRWINGATFAKAFRGGCWPSDATESRISRWETALVRAPYLAIRRYEELLGMESHSLVSVIDALYRYENPISGRSSLDRRIDPRIDEVSERVETLVEKACADAPVTGTEWDELTSYISVIPDLMLIPRARWTKLAERLLLESIIAVGSGWLPRYESFCRLMGHPRGQMAAISTCASLAADTTNLIFVETVCCLDASRHPSAGDAVLAQLTNPTNEQAFFGAMLACVRKTKFGHFTAEQNQDLIRIVGGILIDDPLRYEEVRTVAAHLARNVVPSTGDLDAAMQRAYRGDPTVREVLSLGRLADASRSAIVVRRVVDRILVRLPHDGGGHQDEILPDLVSDILFHPVLDRRLYAGLLVQASPYGHLVAEALAMEIVDPRTAQSNVELTRSVFGALRTFGTLKERPLVERFILQPTIPAIAEAATFAIGHVEGTSDDRFWLNALTRHIAAYERARTPTNYRSITNLVYALGVTRNQGLLRRLKNEGPPEIRTAASWWLNLPRRVYDSGEE